MSITKPVRVRLLVGRSLISSQEVVLIPKIPYGPLLDKQEVFVK